MRRFLTLIFSIFLLYPALTFAHGVGEVYALPVPLDYYIRSSAIAVGYTFLILLLYTDHMREKWSKRYLKLINIAKLPIITSTLKIITFLLFTLAILTGIFGLQEAEQNFTPAFFWIYFLIGMGIASALVGNIWEKLNPWELLTTYVKFKFEKVPLSPIFGIGFLIMLYWLELSSNLSFVPNVLGYTLLVYTIINIFGGSLYKNWFQEIEVFSVMYGYIGKLAYFNISEDNTKLEYRNQNPILGGQAGSIWGLLVVCILLAGTSFDSIKETDIWISFLLSLGFLGPNLFTESMGIFVAPIPFLLSYLLAIKVMKWIVKTDYSFLQLSKKFIWSLIPIAFGYILAHYLSLTIVTAPQMLALISDPFGYGWDIFGTASYKQTTLLLGAKFIWFIEIGLVVGAHIVGVWYAHMTASNIFEKNSDVIKSQIPFGLLMILFTAVTLWLLAQPLVIDLQM